jgi:hypothetical protein
MNNKLQEIKDRVNRLVGFEDAPDNALYYLSKDHINWLIQQAEKADELEQSMQEMSLKRRVLMLDVNRVLLLDTEFHPSFLEDNNAVIAMIDNKYVLFKTVDPDDILNQIKSS